MTIIEGVDVFLNIAGSYRYTKVFKLTLHLDTGAHLIVLFGHLYDWDLSLSKGLSCLSVTAFYKVPVGFLLGHCKIYKRNGKYKQTI